MGHVSSPLSERGPQGGQYAEGPGSPSLVNRALPCVRYCGVSWLLLAAGELLAQRLQRLVRGERARDLGAARTVVVAAAAGGGGLLGRVGRGLAGLDLGLGGLDLLLEVRLPA